MHREPGRACGACDEGWKLGGEIQKLGLLVFAEAADAAVLGNAGDFHEGLAANLAHAGECHEEALDLGALGNVVVAVEDLGEGERAGGYGIEHFLASTANFGSFCEGCLSCSGVRLS